MSTAIPPSASDPFSLPVAVSCSYGCSGLAHAASAQGTHPAPRLWPQTFDRCPSPRRDRSPKGGPTGKPLDQLRHRNGARPSRRPRPANGLASGNDGVGAPSWRPSAPLTDPRNRTVEPKSWGHSAFSFLGAVTTSSAFSLTRRPTTRGSGESKPQSTLGDPRNSPRENHRRSRMVHPDPEPALALVERSPHVLQRRGAGSAAVVRQEEEDEHRCGRDQGSRRAGC
jgi:hypothetical protein